MKIKVLFPIVCLALLIATPQAEAQSKRSERKLKREMRKLEKQMKKVQELKHISYFPIEEEMELKKIKELEKMDEYRNFKFDLDDNQRRMMKEQAAKAREMALEYREMNHEKMREYQEQALQYQLEAREHQQEAREHLRRAAEEQREEFRKLREIYPEGIHIDEIEMPEFDFELPEIDFEFPEFDFDYQKFEGKLPKDYVAYLDLRESDNNLSINTDLEDESIDKEYSFTVADDASYFSLHAKGSVSEGTIEIEIKDPQDNEFQTIELSPAADVDWTQKIKLNDEKKKNLKGKWTISVSGDDVVGHYGLNLRSK